MQLYLLDIFMILTLTFANAVISNPFSERIKFSFIVAVYRSKRSVRIDRQTPDNRCFSHLITSLFNAQ